MVGMELDHVPDIYDDGDDDGGDGMKMKSFVEGVRTIGDEALCLQVSNWATLSCQHLPNLLLHSKILLKSVQIIASSAFLLRI